MNSRERIIEKLRQHRFEHELPDVPSFTPSDKDLLVEFGRSVERNAGRFISCYPDDVASEVKKLHPRADRVASTTGLVNGTVDLRPESAHQVVGAIELFVCFADLGVAENGAVWITDSRLRTRAALFATQHLAIVVRKETIVENMHDAYKKVQIDKEGFGLFVCGPSKTADIEQSLVIGAQGPRSLVVLAIE
jgi:L-lactate dehydrogenase complex protein LldG